MGAWSAQSFGNDDAADFAGELAEAEDLSMVEEALDEVLGMGAGYLEAPEASRAIAAAEVIARLQGHWGERDPFSEPVDQWVESVKLEPSAALVAKVHRVLERILTKPSELLELWEEGKDGPEVFLAAVEELRSRVKT